jgi:hypothetical protein
MDDEELDSGFLNISISDSEDAGDGGSETASRADRKAQSEADFLALKASYRPKVEIGEVRRDPHSPTPAVDRWVNEHRRMSMNMNMNDSQRD